nr:increased DNA methylation 1-like [Coffea arabica]
MAGKSHRRKKQSSNSSSSCSSDNAEDPDYTVRWAQRLSRKEKFTSLSGWQRHSSCDINGLQFTAGTSTMRGKPTRSSKKKDIKQGEVKPIKTSKMAQARKEPGCLKIERINFGIKRSSTSRWNRKIKDEFDQENKFSTDRSGRSSENENDHENQGYSASRIRNQEDENEKWKMKATIFSWLIDSKTIEENAEVFYMDDHSKKIIKEGIIRREGILCNCCDKIFTVANFSIHCGRQSAKPYERIFTSKNQNSLLSCMIRAWNMPEECESRKFNRIQTRGNASDSYDDACMICADGGNLMCCELCNSTYHQDCIQLKEVPRGSWYCPYCVCRFCRNPAHDNDYLIECPQCEQKYHWNCHLRREMKIIDLNSMPCAPFCEGRCKEVYDKLERNLVGLKNELDEGFSWSLLHHMDNDTGSYTDDTYKRIVCHSKLAVALRLMDDCFEPIVDRHTRINVIRSVVYNCGANFKRIQFRGFYTAVLEKDDEIISVASLRIHGTKLAEMPFIATSDQYRCKGMCKKLMVAIESVKSIFESLRILFIVHWWFSWRFFCSAALCYLNVESLVIPSTSERISNWIEKYGFRLLDSTLNREIICRNTLMFHDSVRLQKSLGPSCLAKSDRSIGATSSVRKARINQQQNWLSFSHKAAMASLFDLDFQPPEWNKNPWMNSRERMPYR